MRLSDEFAGVHGGEGYFALATEWRLWLELRSLPRRRMKACFPPN